MRARLAVVDQAPVRKGGTAGDALRESIALAEHCEALGYARFWVAEHHSLPGIASTSPEILIGQIAARTRAIRVGSGGVMLMHYSALKVAENFRMLESLFPGRIDCGLGRAPGSDQRTAAALAYPGEMRSVHQYPDQVDDLVRFLADDLPAGHPFRGIQASPTRDGMPEVWLLGSGVDEDGNGIRARLKGDERKRYEDLRAKLAAFDSIRPKPLPIGSGITDVGCEAPVHHVMAGGAYDGAREEAAPGFPTIFRAGPPEIRTALKIGSTDPPPTPTCVTVVGSIVA